VAPPVLTGVAAAAPAPGMLAGSHPSQALSQPTDASASHMHPAAGGCAPLPQQPPRPQQPPPPLPAQPPPAAAWPGGAALGPITPDLAEGLAAEAQQHAAAAAGGPALLMPSGGAIALPPQAALHAFHPQGVLWPAITPELARQLVEARGAELQGAALLALYCLYCAQPGAPTVKVYLSLEHQEALLGEPPWVCSPLPY
jgi:hypothetical protein